MVNSDVDGYSKTLNHRKILLKRNSLNSKKNICEGPVLKFNLPGVPSRQLHHWSNLCALFTTQGAYLCSTGI